MADRKCDLMEDALLRIAKGTFINQAGNAQAITKVDLINIARDACYAAGTIWSKTGGVGKVPAFLKPGDKNV